MMECVAVETPRDLLGTVVIPKRGRDKGRPCILVGWLSEDYALIADGSLRKAAKPKKKNIKHLIYTKCRPGAMQALYEAGGGEAAGAGVGASKSASAGVSANAGAGSNASADAGTGAGAVITDRTIREALAAFDGQ